MGGQRGQVLASFLIHSSTFTWIKASCLRDYSLKAVLAVQAETQPGWLCFVILCSYVCSLDWTPVLK